MTRVKKQFDLNGKVAIITGASKGIGESIARGLAEFGAKVIVSSRKQEAVGKSVRRSRSCIICSLSSPIAKSRPSWI